MALKSYSSLSLAHAASQVAADLANGSREMRDGLEWAKSTSPIVIELQGPDRFCPILISLGDPFHMLLASYAWLFPTTESSRYPKFFDPLIRMPDSAGPSAMAASVIGNGRQVVQVANHLATFEMNGSPDAHGVLDMNLVVSTGSVLEAIAPWGIRWMMYHSAVAAYAGLMTGSVRMFVMHPCAPLKICASVINESSEVSATADDQAMVSVVSGDPGEWARDARMFIDEHIWANGYQDRFVLGVLKPAMAAWHNLIDPDQDQGTRVDRALDALKSVRDANWRLYLSRYAEMQRA